MRRQGGGRGRKDLIEEVLSTWFDRLESAPFLVLMGAAAAAGFIETIFPPFPSEALILVASFSAARQSLPPLPMVLAAGLGSFVSLYALYWAGRGPFRDRVQRRVRKTSPRADDMAGRFYARWGYGVILISRFLPAVRGPIVFMAGVYGLSPGRMALILLAACLIWNAVVVAIGTRAGRSWDGTTGNLVSVGILMAAATALLWLLGFALRRLLDRRF